MAINMSRIVAPPLLVFPQRLGDLNSCFKTTKQRWQQKLLLATVLMTHDSRNLYGLHVRATPFGSDRRGSPEPLTC